MWIASQGLVAVFLSCTAASYEYIHRVCVPHRGLYVVPRTNPSHTPRCISRHASPSHIPHHVFLVSRCAHCTGIGCRHHECPPSLHSTSFDRVTRPVPHPTLVLFFFSCHATPASDISRPVYIRVWHIDHMAPHLYVAVLSRRNRSAYNSCRKYIPPQWWYSDELALVPSCCVGHLRETGFVGGGGRSRGLGG